MARSTTLVFGAGALVTGGDLFNATVPLGTIAATVTTPAPSIFVATSGVNSRFLDGVSGSDSNDGTTWGQAWLTPAYAAAQAPDSTRIWVAPATYTISSMISYSKRLWWEGPKMPANQIQAQVGSAWFEASGSPAYYFDISSAAGGGFIEVGFSNRPVTSGIVRSTSVTDLKFDNVYTHPTNPVSNSQDYHKPLLTVEGSGDNSRLEFVDCDAHSSPLIYAHLIGVARDWRIVSPRCQSDVSTTTSHIDLAGDFDGLYLEACYLEKTTLPAIIVDMSSVPTARRVTMVPGGFERLSGNSYGIALYGCQLDVGFAGGQWSANGLFYGSTDCTGYVMSPTSILKGALVAGVN